MASKPKPSEKKNKPAPGRSARFNYSVDDPITVIKAGESLADHGIKPIPGAEEEADDDEENEDDEDDARKDARPRSEMTDAEQKVVLGHVRADRWDAIEATSLATADQYPASIANAIADKAAAAQTAGDVQLAATIYGKLGLKMGKPRA